MLDAPRSLDALDRIGEGIFALDPDGRLAYLNRTAQQQLNRLLGRAAVDLLGSVLWDCSPSFTDTPLGIGLRRAQNEGLPVVQPLRDPVSGEFLELRAWPSPEGLSAVIREAELPRAARVLDGVSDLFLACDHDWHLTLVNARVEEHLRLLGQRQADLLGRVVWEAIPGLVGTRFQAEAFRALAEQSEVEFEAFFRPLERWFAVRITPAPDGIIACARDVTGWRRAERALTHEAERLAAVIETQQAVATAGPDLGAVMHAVAERLQALTQAAGAAVFVPDDEALVLCEGSGIGAPPVGLRVPLRGSLIGLCHSTGQLLRCDDARIDPRVDSETATALQLRSALVVPLLGENGVQAVVAIWSPRPRAFHDLHEHTLRLVGGLLSAAMERASAFAANQVLLVEHAEAIAQLREGKDRFRALVESIDDVVFRLDRDQRCVDVFGRWLEREGFRREEFLGRTTRDIVGSATAPAHERANLRALAGETVTYEWMLQTGRGPRHMQTTLSPLRGPDGEISGIVGVGRDITQRIEAEQQIRQAQKMEAVGRFAGGVAHDLNNMMMIILGFSDFLLANLDSADRRRSDADEIRKAAERAMHLTRQLLGFGRQRLVAREVLSVNDVVQGMERMLRPLLGEDIALDLRLALGLGGVEADQGQLEQVIMNLALNARDAMRGGGRLIIETSNVDVPHPDGEPPLGADVPPGSYVLLQVTDTGHGMTPEVKARLFEPFFSTKPTTHNTGLGLATVYGIVVQSGGYIWVDTEPGRGSVFRLCFPRVPPDESGLATAAPHAAALGGSETVLLVEDEEAVRILANRVLTAQGYVVLEARNGREALAVAEQVGGRIDLLLTDVVMPEMGGRELVDRLARMLPGIRIMYMSGYSEADKLDPGIRDSACVFLQKPFSTENLALRVREALDRTLR